MSGNRVTWEMISRLRGFRYSNRGQSRVLLSLSIMLCFSSINGFYFTEQSVFEGGRAEREAMPVENKSVKLLTNREDTPILVVKVRL